MTGTSLIEIGAGTVAASLAGSVLIALLTVLTSARAPIYGPGLILVAGVLLLTLAVGIVCIVVGKGLRDGRPPRKGNPR